MNLDNLYITVNVPTTKQEIFANYSLNQGITNSALPKLKKNEKLDEIVKDINESIDKSQCKIGCLLIRIDALNTQEMDYVIRKIDSNPLNIDFNHPINEKLQIIKSEIIRRVIEDRKNNPENFNKKLFHFFRLVLAKDEKIKRILTDKTIPEKFKKKLSNNINKKISKNIKEINKRISTLDEKTLIYFENSYESAKCDPPSGIIRVSHSYLDKKNLVDAIGHELGHIILCHMIPKDKNRIRQFEELLCDTFAAYTLSLFGKKETTPRCVEYNKEFTEEKNGEGHPTHPDFYTRNRIKNYILRRANLELVDKEIESIIGNIEEYRYTPKERELIGHIIKDEYEEAIKMLEEDPNIKIISTPENIEKIIEFICNHGLYFSKEKSWLDNIEGDYWGEYKELTFDKMLENNSNLLKNNYFLIILRFYLKSYEKRINITDENKSHFLDIILKIDYRFLSFIELDELLEDATNIESQYSSLSRRLFVLQAYVNKNFKKENEEQKEIDVNQEGDLLYNHIDIKNLFPYDIDVTKLFPNYIDVTKQNVEKCFLLLESFKTSPRYDTLFHLFKDDQNILQNYINSHNLLSSKS